MAAAAPTPTKSRKRVILDNIVSLGLALLLVLMIRSSFIEPYKIPSGSMIPTLLVGDHIFVNKFAYGLKLPFAEWIWDDPIYLFKLKPPKRGDIIVFKYPRDESIYYIKRIIGLPGDKIELKDKHLTINGQAISEEPVTPEEREKVFKALQDGDKYDLNSLDLYHTGLKDDKPILMQDRSSESGFLTDNYGPKEVPADHYFCMGDNRDHSNDSRIWGFVPARNIKGRAFVIWMSAWVDFGQSEFIFRPTRIGTLLK